MATKLHGMLNLSKIDMNAITVNSKGESIIWIDVMENLNGPDQYGNTHTVTVYNKLAPEGRKLTYLANLKPAEFGNGIFGRPGAIPVPGQRAAQPESAFPVRPTQAPIQPQQARVPLYQQPIPTQGSENDLPF